MGKILGLDNFFIQKRKDPPYPPHQKGEMLEYQFYDYFNENQNEISDTYTYLPVMWTNLYANFRSNKGLVHSRVRKEILPLLNPNGKYFTIVQSAKGIEMPLPKNVLIFSQGGVGDVPLPLISTPASGNIKTEKTIFASFIGRDTHKCRRILYDQMKNKEGYFIEMIGNISTPITKENQNTFKSIMSKSVFTLAPLGS